MISIRYQDMATKRQIGFSPSNEETVALFARVPASAGKKLSRAAIELGRPKQAVIAELVDRYASTLGDDFTFGRATITDHPLEVLTPEQLADLLHVEVATVLAMATDGQIPGRQLNGNWRFARSAVLAWLAGNDE
jgi:excisionase family DNA binding protein